ncbi:MAG: Gfo/Idh/MocA family oxidoreductase [Saprospiraceae bacterium]|nr:Gfo/Idh/MocA family oxidoreductase [Saprospiraceae bacterium]
MGETRRKFIWNAALAGASLGMASNLGAKPFPKTIDQNSKLKIGIIGSGFRGQSHIDLLLRRNDCELICIAEPDQVMLGMTKKLVEELGGKWPAIYDQGTHDYIRMLGTEEIDAVIVATPWEWHSQMAIASMKAGVYTGLEVSGAISIDECWELVNTHEATGTPLYFLENVCFRRDVMAVLNMVKQGLFGELIHLECGYQHDLRGVKFNDGVSAYNSGVEFGEKGFSEAKWRTWHSQYRNGDLYPTHGIGPVAQWINLNRGNRMESLVSMASKARGLHEYIVNHPKGGPEHPNAKLEFKLGDKVTTMVKCTNGETIVLHHDTNLPRPYSLGFRVQGTKGLWMDVNKSLHIEGLSKDHQWETAENYLATYDHDFWKAHEKDAEGAGHGGMDWFLIDSFVRCALDAKEIPFDVYDAASWMAITPMSETSITGGGVPQLFPDFTRGRWKVKNEK